MQNTTTELDSKQLAQFIQNEAAVAQRSESTRDVLNFLIGLLSFFADNKKTGIAVLKNEIRIQGESTPASLLYQTLCRLIESDIDTNDLVTALAKT